MSRKASSPDGRGRRFEALLLPEFGFLAHVARSMSRSEAEAEDLAQEVALKAFVALDRFDGRHPRAWLFTIARNAAITRDARRRHALLGDHDLLDTYASRSHASADPESLVVDAAMEDTIARALDGLPPVFRAVVDLVDVDGMLYKEAADFLEIPVGTVMSRLHRGRRRIREALVGLCPEAR